MSLTWDTLKGLCRTLTRSFPTGKIGDELVKDLVEATPGSDLNLSRDEIASFNKPKGSERKQVENALREMLLQRYRSYKEKGS